MSVRTKILSIVDVVLRVPPLFVIDELLKIGLGFPGVQDSDYINEVNEVLSLNATKDFTTVVAIGIYEYAFVVLFKFLFCLIACASSLCIFALLTKHLMIVYMYLASVGIVFVSYWTNVSAMKSVLSVLSAENASSTSILEDLLLLNVDRLLDPSGCVAIVVQNYVVQFFFGAIFAYIHLGPRNSIIQKVLPISFIAPSVLSILPLPPSFLIHAPVFASLLPLILIKFVIWSSVMTVFQTVYGGYVYVRTFVSNFGISALIETEWVRLNVPCVLRTFWLLRVFENMVSFVLTNYSDYDVFNLEIVFPVIRNVMVTGCETLTAVLGMTSIVSFVCHYFGCFFQWILLIDDEDDKSIGTVTAILFYILSLQTGLTTLDPEKRFLRLCRNFCLLFTALLHFIHNIVNPLLMSLSASHNPTLHRHFRALGVCCFLIMFPITLLVYLWGAHEMSTWLLAVTAFSVEVMVKVCVSLMIYCLFLIDAYRTTFWEKLDDYVYYIRAFGNTVEFMFGIFLFFNGAWILIFESGGAIRAIMMCIHAYFNIWCEARAGWSVFMKRRTAVNKINSLPEADLEQLERLEDLCAICYQEMKSAKITKCRHYFHGVCLRKWLYVQDRCPLCHKILYKVDNNDFPKNQAANAGDNEQQRLVDNNVNDVNNVNNQEADLR